jgi:hypothetical protein
MITMTRRLLSFLVCVATGCASPCLASPCLARVYRSRRWPLSHPEREPNNKSWGVHMSLKRSIGALAAIAVVGAAAWLLGPDFDPDSPANLSAVERRLISKLESLPSGRYPSALFFNDDWKRICFGGVGFEGDQDPAFLAAMQNWRFREERHSSSLRGTVIISKNSNQFEVIVLPQVSILVERTDACVYDTSLEIDVVRSQSGRTSLRIPRQRPESP